MDGRLNISERGLRRAALALLLVWAAGAFCPAFAAVPGGGMAMDVLNSVTKSPASRQSNSTFGSPYGSTSGAGPSSTGPVAPKQPKAPLVPGAKPLSDEPLRRDDRPAAPARKGGQKGAQKTAPQARQQVLVLPHAGAERKALLTLPKAAPLKKGQAAPKVPVLIVLHGAGGSAAQAMRQTGLAERAAAAGFLAVFPEGSGPNGAGGEGQTWNAWTCCGYARDSHVDDVGYLSALIARLRADFAADPARIHLVGFSNGAMLASRFALERPGVAATLTSVAGYLPCDTKDPADSLPVLVIHGAQDKVARFAPTEAKPATGRYCEDYPARAQVDFWVRGMNLSPTPQVRDSGKTPARVEDYAPKGKAGRGSVRFVIVKNGGHAWPGGERERYRYCDMPTTGIDASALVLEFAKRSGGGAPQPDAAQD
ncbi:MAG TPA: dienelactone hydrolase family protein, partial [Humidesulfovibrio sp.]|uniref:alpha/beta hydrolase family esterase n=1 Tax=Humidesulfovibrio sp. TaxID=2910988 RepID=UPI002CC79EE6